jgi:hypothetical protein
MKLILGILGMIFAFGLVAGIIIALDRFPYLEGQDDDPPA